MKITTRRIILATTLVVAAVGAGVNYAYHARMAASDSDAYSGIESEGLHLVLNVPANRLFVYENGVRTRTYSVSVGTSGYETPQGQYRINEVIWNPWWNPPPSGWARGRKTEPPGPSNPMGRAKLNFGPLLYIHGTSAYQAIGRPASKGCVRMRNGDVMELARLVHRYASPSVEAALLNQLESSPSMTRRIGLAKSVRFTAEYNLATVDDGFLILYPDIYKRVRSSVRAEVDQALRDAGVNPSRVNRAHLDRLLAKSATRRVAISLDELMSTSALGDDRGRDAVIGGAR